MKKQPSSPEQKRDWANQAQLAFLDAISTETKLDISNLVFQGGTSLSLSWGSPRFSEDLDFLLSKGSPIDNLKDSMGKIQNKIQRTFSAMDSGFTVTIKDKSRNNGMLVFDVIVSNENFIGNSRVKTEFWTVNKDYLKKYESEYKTPQLNTNTNIIGKMTNQFPIPSSTLESVLADKVVALAYRGRVKWRDVFDVWWISQKLDRGLDTLSIKSLTDKALHHETAYSGEGLLKGLENFIQERETSLINKEGCDLDRWLPESMKTFLDGNIDQMVAQTLNLVKQVHNQLQKNESNFRSEHEQSIVQDIEPGM